MLVKTTLNVCAVSFENPQPVVACVNATDCSEYVRAS